MMMDITLVVAGLGVLLVAGDLLVKGAVNLALRLGIPALLVGMTVVAFGTSAPELLVSVQAVLTGAAGLALGNVVGSNIANILLVLGAPALISAVAVGRDITRDYLIMMAASVLFVVLAFTGEFGTWQVMVLLVAFALFMADSLYRGIRARAALRADELEGADPGITRTKLALCLVGGIIGLPVGANLLVSGAVNIAESFGVSDALIGLTLVAIGTSLPELATTVMAAIRREGGVALGNILGSNLFNLLAIIGIAGLFGTLPVPPEMLRLDLWVMLGASAVLAPFIWRARPISRAWGIVLLIGYLAYIWFLIIQGV